MITEQIFDCIVMDYSGPLAKALATYQSQLSSVDLCSSLTGKFYNGKYRY